MGKTICVVARTAVVALRSLMLVILLSGHVSAQEDSAWFDEQAIRYENRVYHPAVKTVLLERKDEPLSDPVIILKSNDRLELSFDLLEEEIRDLSYRIVHCDRNWQVSRLSESDYISGFYSDHIIDYAHSLNTNVDYWHYRLNFPNEQMSPAISGNYLLIVFENSEPDKALLTRRFRVIEQLSEIMPNIHRATSIDVRNSHQEIDFAIRLSGVKIQNPFSEVMVEIIQNSNESQTIKSLKPFFVNGEVLDFNHDEGNLFEGGTEYRPLDLRTSRFLTANVAAFETNYRGYAGTAILKTDQRTSSQRYSSAEDLNGKFVSKIYEGRDGNLEGDYLDVIFQLKAPADFTESPVYIDGSFTDNRKDRAFRMNYSADSSVFKQTILLKQGFYNYRYITLDEKGQTTVLETEGSHYETSNHYEILVYWTSSLLRYDRLIGYLKTRTGG